MVTVKKSNRKWRMCMDYTDLNRACPKDAYTLPNINRTIDGVAKHKMLIFLDAYFGYNQIRMDPKGKEKMTFIIKFVNFCYKVMFFGLKNVKAMYQRLMDKVFQS